MLLSLHHLRKSNPPKEVVSAVFRFADLDKYKVFDYVCRIAPDGCALIFPYDIIKNKPVWGREFLKGEISQDGETDGVKCTIQKGTYTGILFSPKNF